ncbi:MAG: hypothetical protein L0Y80_09955 [Ignavibacteriae bacterium]|nr:hypothetical protein [Ignavibacteriota bacterium]
MNPFRTVNVVLLLVIVSYAGLKAQDYVGDESAMEPVALIDKPTAGMLKRGGYLMSINMYNQGGVLFSIAVGAWDPFMFGISYGGTSIIGDQKVDMNPLPAVQAKVRLINETEFLPAIAIGFDSQGKGRYFDGLVRYMIKSPGVFAVVSKNYSFIGYLSLHGGVNISLERSDGDKDMDIFTGMEKSLGSTISLMLEYDLGFNDNHGEALGRFKGRGYLNFGVRWSITSGWVLGFNMKDLFQTQGTTPYGTRTLQLDYTGVF